MADRIEISIENHIAVMTIRRPEKLNALDIPLLQELSTACDQVEADSSVRVAILTGEGKAFSAGGDIKAWGGMEPQEFGHAWVRYGHRVFERLATLRVPLIAAMNGHALGAVWNWREPPISALLSDRRRSACRKLRLA
ncbi:enoyl-CoA hydratase [Brucella abortus]|nr:enoyl-CoA hydratase [Brucella abortus]SUW29514.1 enoyl-CoA hydratase [Brucella abortus]